jgi:hypothetical protein
VAVTVERWGGPPPSAGAGAAGAAGRRADASAATAELLWTLRRESPAGVPAAGAAAAASAGASAVMALEVEAAPLGLADGVYPCEVLSNGWRGGAAVQAAHSPRHQPPPPPLSLKVDSGAGLIAPIQLTNATLLLRCASRTVVV